MNKGALPGKKGNPSSQASKGDHSLHTMTLLPACCGCLPWPFGWPFMRAAATRDAAPAAVAGTEPGGLGIIVVGLPAPDWAPDGA